MTYSLREAKKLLREWVCIDFIGYETDSRRIDSRINTEYHKDIENIIQDIMDWQHNWYKINRVYIYTNDNKDCLWIAKQVDKQWVAYNTVNTQQKIADWYSDIDYSTRYSDFAAYEYAENMISHYKKLFSLFS